MIISDLNYVEVVTESTEVIGGRRRGTGGTDVSNKTTQFAVANVGGEDSIIIGSPAVALNINSAILTGLSAFS